MVMRRMLMAGVACNVFLRSAQGTLRYSVSSVCSSSCCYWLINLHPLVTLLRHSTRRGIVDHQIRPSSCILLSQFVKAMCRTSFKLL